MEVCGEVCSFDDWLGRRGLILDSRHDLSQSWVAGFPRICVCFVRFLSTWEGSPLDGTCCPACWEVLADLMHEIRDLRLEAWHALRATVPQFTVQSDFSSFGVLPAKRYAAALDRSCVLPMPSGSGWRCPNLHSWTSNPKQVHAALSAMHPN